MVAVTALGSAAGAGESYGPLAAIRKQVQRLGAFKAAHPPPDVTVLPPRAPYCRWRAIISEDTVPGDSREMILTDPDLGAFVGRLEELFDRPG